MKYLGVDYGEKRIGLALADGETKIASPFKVVGDVDEVVKNVKNEDIDIIVLGEPLKMQNAKLMMNNDFLEFIDLLKKKINIPIKTIDERLSSKAADALVGDKKTRAPRDAVSAMLILQTYLDGQIKD